MPATRLAMVALLGGKGRASSGRALQATAPLRMRPPTHAWRQAQTVAADHTPPSSIGLRQGLPQSPEGAPRLPRPPDPELVRLVCVKHFRQFHDRSIWYAPQPRAFVETHRSGLTFVRCVGEGAGRGAAQGWVGRVLLTVFEETPSIAVAFCPGHRGAPTTLRSQAPGLPCHTGPSHRSTPPAHAQGRAVEHPQGRHAAHGQHRTVSLTGGGAALCGGCLAPSAA
jgi:hypothetical protein